MAVEPKDCEERANMTFVGAFSDGEHFPSATILLSSLTVLLFFRFANVQTANEMHSSQSQGDANKKEKSLFQ